MGRIKVLIIILIFSITSNCYAATEFLVAGSWETGDGNTMWQDFSNPSGAQPTPVWNAKQNYVGRFAWKSTAISFPASFTDGEWITVTFPIQFNFTSIASVLPFFVVSDNSGNAYIWLKYDDLPNTKTIKIYDANDALIGTLGFTFEEDVWYVFDVKFNPQDGAGDVKIFVDGSEVFDSSGEDFDTGAATDQIRLELTEGINGITYYAANAVAISDDGANIDTNETWGKEYVVMYYDFADGDATGDFGDALNAGIWDDMHEVPKNDANNGKYTGNDEGGCTTHDGATRTGPLGDSDVDGTIIGAAWGWRMKRDGSPIGRSTFKAKYGANNVVGADNTVSVNYQLRGGATAWSNRFIFKDATDGNVPTKIEYFQQGFGRAFAMETANVFCGEMWSMLIHEELPPVPSEANVIFYGANF